MVVPQEQLAAVSVVHVHHVDERLPGVREAEEELLFHGLELPALDLVAIVPLVVAERVQLLLDHEFRSEELVDERDVVVERADLEDLLAAEAGAPIPMTARFERVAVFPFLAELALVPAL